MYKLRLFIFILFCWFSGRAQNIFYSPPVGNYPYSHSKIIGRVKGNIVVYNHTWSHTFDMRNSNLLIYDGEMHLLKEISFNSITPKISVIDFINEGDRFLAVLQYREHEFSVCKFITFDAAGTIVKTKIVERSRYVKDDNYLVMGSTKDHALALLKITAPGISGALSLKYHFIKDDSLIHSDEFLFPFDTVSSGLGRALLDDDNLIMPVHDTLNGDKITLFKLDLRTNSSTNTVRNVPGHLVLQGLRINGNASQYVVTSPWENGNATGSGPRLFLWQLQKDLTDISVDTVMVADTSNLCLHNIYYYQANNIVLQNNSSNIIISAGDVQAGFGPGLSHASYPTNTPPAPGGRGGSFYEGRVIGFMPQKSLNGNGTDNFAQVSHGPTWASNQGPMSGSSSRFTRPQAAALAILHVDNQNHLQWMQCFNASMQEGFKSLINEGAFVVVENSLHIIYLKTVQNGRQTLGDLIMKPDGQYETKPIISMNLKSKYLLDQSLQVDADVLIIPCVINDKLSFAKLILN